MVKHNFELKEASIMSPEKELKEIVEMLFLKSKPHSDYLKSMLLVPKENCITNMPNYKTLLDSYSIQKLKQEGYIRFSPKLSLDFNSSVNASVIITFDGFTPNATNGYYRDHFIKIFCLCNTDIWDLEDFACRPIKMAGYIDAIMRSNRLVGIGKVDFAAMSEVVFSENVSGYIITFKVYNGNDDREKLQ